jgi:hypothetical protein
MDDYSRRSRVDVEAPEMVRIQRDMLSLISQLKLSAVLEFGSSAGVLGSRIVDLVCCYVSLESVDRPLPDGAEEFRASHASSAQVALRKFDRVFSNDCTM